MFNPIKLSTKYINEVIKHGFRTSKNKDYNNLLIKKFCKKIGVKYGVTVSSGTSALHVALLSIGLKKNDLLNLDISKLGKNKLFYDVIYKPDETNFLKEGKKLGNRTENGKLMFIHQALAAFKVWHGIQPKINREVLKILDQ